MSYNSDENRLFRHLEMFSEMDLDVCFYMRRDSNPVILSIDKPTVRVSVMLDHVRTRSIYVSRELVLKLIRQKKIKPYIDCSVGGITLDEYLTAHDVGIMLDARFLISVDSAFKFLKRMCNDEARTVLDKMDSSK